MTTIPSVVVGASVIDGLINSPEARATFPVFANPPMERRGGCCGRRRAETINYNTIKRALAGLADTDQKKLLQLLGASSATLHYKVGRQNQTKVLPT